jgi:hypothetical protein
MDKKSHTRHTSLDVSDFAKGVFDDISSKRRGKRLTTIWFFLMRNWMIWQQIVINASPKEKNQLSIFSLKSE